MTADTKQELISLSELAKDRYLNVNKSKLAYYAKIGLIAPISKVSSTQIYDKQEVIKVLKAIQQMQMAGFTLLQIKQKLGQSQ